MSLDAVAGPLAATSAPRTAVSPAPLWTRAMEAWVGIIPLRASLDLLAQADPSPC